MQTIVDQFWRVWHRWYFPTLLLRQKWHVERRNVAIGDVCMLKDSNTHRGEWRICKVTNVFPDNRGKVSNVEVVVTPKQTGSGPYMDAKQIKLYKHVCNLIVIVLLEDSTDAE